MLFTQDTVFQFWPSQKQTPAERIESTARFIIYGSLIAFAMKRNVKILILGTVLLVGLYYYSQNVKQPMTTLVNENPEDPFGNFQDDKVYRPTRARRWAEDTFTSDVRNAERNFYTAPSNDLDNFLDFVHGGKNKPFCRQDQKSCVADLNPMFMEHPQARATFNIW
jgi:hypothetical protein